MTEAWFDRFEGTPSTLENVQEVAVSTVRVYK